jgi:hypothetical protein
MQIIPEAGDWKIISRNRIKALWAELEPGDE